MTIILLKIIKKAIIFRWVEEIKKQKTCILQSTEKELQSPKKAKEALEEKKNNISLV